MKLKVCKLFYANGNQKRAEVAIFVSNKVDFKTVTRRELLFKRNLFIKRILNT